MPRSGDAAAYRRSGGQAWRGLDERGRRVDLQGAMLTREKFSAAACLPAVREGLRSVVGDEWATQWKL